MSGGGINYKYQCRTELKKKKTRAPVCVCMRVWWVVVAFAVVVAAKIQFFLIFSLLSVQFVVICVQHQYTHTHTLLIFCLVYQKMFDFYQR